MKNVLIFNKFLVTMIHTSNAHPGGVTPDFKWRGWSNGGKNQTPKNSHAEFPSHKNFQRNYAAGIRGNYHESSDCLEYPKKNPFLNQATRKTLAEIFLTKIENFKPQKILRSSLSLEIRSFPRPWAAYKHRSLLRSSYSLVTQRSTFVCEKRSVTRQPHNHQFTSFLWHHAHAQNKGAY